MLKRMEMKERSKRAGGGGRRGGLCEKEE